MGILMFMMAALPSLNASSVNLLRAESTGPSPDKIVPKIRQTARILYMIYIALTVLLIVFLIISGLPVYDSLINAFSTAGTGGFSSLNASIGGYNSLAAEIVITIFMFLFGVNFSLYFLIFDRKFSRFIRDAELKVYFGVVAAAILIVHNQYFRALRRVRQRSETFVFQVSSIITTTGYATAGFQSMAHFKQSNTGVFNGVGRVRWLHRRGIKLIRFIILFKAVKSNWARFFTPEE